MNTYVLITGASAGIGKAYAYAFAQRGYNLVLVARRKAKLQEIQTDITQSHAVDVLCYDADLTEKRIREKVIKKVATLPLAILVNNAGFGDYGAFETSACEKQLSMIDLNIAALVHMTHALLPILRKTASSGLTKNSYVMNIGSVAGLIPCLPYMTNYSATKAYVLSFSEALAEECSKMNKVVHVCVVCPGPTQSEFAEVASLHGDKNAFTQSFRKQNWHKIPTAQSLAEYSIKHMMRKKRVIVHGKKFMLLQLFCRFLPRILITKIISLVQTSGKNNKNTEGDI